MKDAVFEWHPEPNAKGTYKVWDAIEEEQIWATRTTPVKKYVDDVMWQFFGNSEDFQTEGCTVKAASRSRSLSYYDYNTNFCNMWNVLTVVDGPDALAGLTTEECKWRPQDPKETCMKY